MAADTYGEALGKLVRSMLKYDEQSDIFRRNNISKRHYYSVINPNAETSGGNPFYCPTEWVVRLTNDSGDYSLLRTIAKDCKCLLITPEEIEKLQSSNPEETIKIFQQILGIVKEK